MHHPKPIVRRLCASLLDHLADEDAIVDLVATGRTLRANGLVAVEEIMPVSARLIVNQAALKTKRAALQPLIEAFGKAARQ